MYALDAEAVSYDVEMQNDFGRDLPRRCRYYQAELDVSSLKPGEDYKELKPSYIIFICAFDPFGKGRYQYVFEEYCKEAGLALGDGTQKIFFNTNGTDSENITPQLLHLFEYLKQSTEEVANMHNDEKIQLIHRRVEYLKRDRKLEAGYMTMEEYIHSEAERSKRDGGNAGKANGRINGKANGRNAGKTAGGVNGKTNGRIAGGVTCGF